MLLVYTHKITPRLRYTLRHLFNSLLRIEVKFTSQINEFVEHKGNKISYTLKPLEGELFFESHSLLFENKIRKDLDIEVERVNDLPFFFKTSENCALGFDIFASSFYLLSRYEEHLVYKTKLIQEFAFAKSLAYKNDFLQIPVVELWAIEVSKLIKEKFPDLVFPEKKFQFISLYSITQYWAFKKIGFFKALGDIIKDLNSNGIKSIYERFLVFIGSKKDPFDNYEEIIKDKKKYSIETIMFFLVGDYDIILDDSLCTYNPDFHYLIKSMSDYIKIGLYVLNASNKKSDFLEKEKNHIEEILHYPIKKSLQSFFNLDIPLTYRKLIDIDLCEDYSMGYFNCKGFRAGTCTPFLFYDLENETTTPLKIFPVSASCLSEEREIPTEKNTQELLALLKKVKEVGGTFLFSLSNKTLAKESYWREVYYKLLDSL